MKNKITPLISKYIYVFVLLAFFSPITVSAQAISAVTNGSPAHGGTVFQRCDSSNGTFAYWSTFAISGSFGSGNTFTLQLSDSSGSFGTPTFLSSSPTFSGSTGEFSFFLPSTTSGTGYKLRVISSNPVVSSVSSAVPSYSIVFNQSFWLNNQNQNVSICGGGSFTLSVDANTVADPSPIIYPNLKYKWFKNNILVSGQTGSTYIINSSGTYRAEVDYGVCSNVAVSRNVVVNIVPAGSTFTITSSGGNTVCPPTANTLSVPGGYAYQWFKDNVAIPGATAFNYPATQPGDYYVVVNQGSCSSTSNTVNLSVVGFSASIDVLESPAINNVPAGEIKTITITTNAASPTFEWYLNGVLIPSATTDTYSTNVMGNYKAIVKQTVGCLVNKEFLFQLKEGVNPVKIPNLISPNADGDNDTWEIPQEYINANTEVMIVSATGEIALQTTNYDNKWPQTALNFKSVNPVYYYIISKDGSPIKKGSITIIK
ncbi:MAG: gliding motility-associated C-terminal domain-containing protein [Flavobacterium sp.]|uniref:T9SS type B sorting domain-containing protein n=1 Tax=Flavobacterium sp. TaxID=239 RepID=UPI003266587C